MKKNTLNKADYTNDRSIRISLRVILDKKLKSYRNNGQRVEIFEELGVWHGTARIDFAIINGIMCGYEIKSDRDTLERLPKQMEEFSNVFDELTLVVGKRHLYKALHIIPDWWGIMIAKNDSNNHVVFQTIRKADRNNSQNMLSIARLLWREEALQILEERNKASGLRNKPRKFIYEKLVEILDIETLKQRVNELLISRIGWRSGQPLG